MGKPKKPVSVKHLANWYFGNFCSRCSNVDKSENNYGKDCYDKIQRIADKLIETGTNIMTHKEFRMLIRYNSTFCNPSKREFHECPICKAFGIKQRW